MKNINLNNSTVSRWILIIMMILIPLGCSSRKDENAPLAPSTPASFAVTPASAQVIKGDAQQFTQRGGVGAVAWTVSDTTLATINISTAVLVASTRTGSVTVTATDNSGRKATSTVTIIDNKIIVLPSALTMSALGPQTATFTQYGASGTTTVTLTGNTNGYKGAAISSAGLLTVATWPTATQGTQTLTITVNDGISTAGTATVTLPVTDTRLTVSPATLSLGLLTNATTVTYVATPASGTVIYNLTGETNGYTGAKIASSTGVVTLTTSPTAAQGTQTLTITASDGVLTGTATLTLTVT